MQFFRKVMLSLVILSMSLLGISSVSPGRALPFDTGTVCIADIATNSCSSPPSPPGGGLGSQMEVAVNIQDAASLNAFDIYVKTDPGTLKALSFDLTGTILGPSFIEVVHCIDMEGPGCSPYTTGPGVVRVAAVALAYSTPAPTTGRLFSIKYNVTSINSGIISFQTGCSPSSTSTNACVLVVLGYDIVNVVIDPTQSGPGDFLMTGQETPLVVPKNTFRFASVTVTSVNGFYGGIGLSVEVAPKKGPFGLKADFFISTIGVFLPPGTSTILIVQVSALPLAPPGDYTVTVIGTSGSLVHTVSFTATVPRQ